MLIAKLYGVDITSKGSGNIGATNVARNLGKLPGVLTLLIDAGKGITAVVLISKFGGDPLLHGLFVTLGHCISIPRFFKGGKGAATGLGVIFSFSPFFGLVAVTGFVLAFILTRRVSIGTIAACLIVTIYSFATHQPLSVSVILSCIAMIIIVRHHENIKRILIGQEQQFSFKDKKIQNSSITTQE